MPATSESAQFAAAAAAGAAPGRRKRGRPSRTSAARGVAEMVERELGSGDDDSQAGAAPPTVRHRVSQTSWIWFFFSPTKDPLKFCCRMCGLEDTAKKGGHCITVGLSRDALSTSNLIDHIRRAHSALAARIDEARDAEDLLDKALADKILQQLGDKATSRKLDAWVSRSALTTAETTDVVVALWAIESGIPWNAFASRGWARVRLHLEKSLPSGDTLRRSTFPRVYALVRRCVVGELEKIESCTATSDSWSCGEKNLVSLTVDFVDDDLVPHARCGGSSWNLRDHSADSIREAWSEGPLAAMPDSVLVGAIVCDAGSNFQLAWRAEMDLMVPCCVCSTG